MSRGPVALAVVVLAVGLLPRPASAQFEGLVKQLQGMALPEAPVTLQVRAKPAGEVVAVLAEALKLPLRCSDALAAQRVTLALKERPAREVGEVLAAALAARWQQEGQSLLLQPAEPLKDLDAAGVLALLNTIPRDPPSPLGQRFRIPAGFFTAAQLQVMRTEAGLPGAALSPEQQRGIAGLVGRTDLTMPLLAQMIRKLKELDEGKVTARIKPENGRLVVSGPNWGYELGEGFRSQW